MTAYSNNIIRTNNRNNDNNNNFRSFSASIAVIIYVIMASLRTLEASAILPAHLLLKEGPGVGPGVNAIDGASSEGRTGSDPDRVLSLSGSSRTPKSSRKNGGGSGVRTRPSPSDELPILPLKYPDTATGQDMLPAESDTDPRRLFALLGSDFDPDFASVVRPADSVRNPNGTYAYDIATSPGSLKTSGSGAPGGNRGGRARKLKQNIKLLPFSLPGFMRRKLGSKSQSTNKLVEIKNRNRRRQFENYLVAYSTCPVKYKWKDLGAKFWPRWMREGNCGGGSGGVGGLGGEDEEDGEEGGRSQRSCSIPSGMTCKPRESSMKTVLWWHCRRRLNASQSLQLHPQTSPPLQQQRNNHCSWIPIKYPIIVKCKCSC